ncbi:MAG: 2-phosphosulfolactate phosphatase [Candidatus Heimdallarchaeaceae archaeon]|jgi:2-phosphosulfolactate phosphatase
MPIRIENPLTIEKYRKNNKAVFIIVDTFRATTSLVTLKQSGARRIYVVQNKEDAIEIKNNFSPDCLLIGEEGGLMPSGFDYGNTPSIFQGLDFKDKEIVFTSTSGARAILLLEPNKNVFLGALVNLDRISNEVLKISKEDEREIVILSSGYFNEPMIYIIEDWITSLLIAKEISDQIDDEQIISDSDFLQTTMNLTEDDSSIQSLLRNSPNAESLKKFGFENDVEFATSFNIIDDFLKVKKWVNFGKIKAVMLE